MTNIKNHRDQGFDEDDVVILTVELKNAKEKNAFVGLVEAGAKTVIGFDVKKNKMLISFKKPNYEQQSIR